MRTLFIVLGLTTALAACGASEQPDPCREAPTWDDTVAAIAQRSCVRCHSSQLLGIARQGAPEGLNFDVYPTGTATLTAFADALTSGRMPPPGNDALETTPDDRVFTNEWRRCGFPENAGLEEIE